MHDRNSHKRPEITESHTADQQLDEIANLLAAGILRLRIRQAQAAIKQAKKNSLKKREKPLDAGARKSVHRSRT